MEIDPNHLEVIHNPDQNRFEITINGQTALAEYNIAGKNMIFTHTEVPPAFEGQGVGSRLAAFALDYAKDNGYKIQPLCPFITSYVRRHPEYHAFTWGYRSS